MCSWHYKTLIFQEDGARFTVNLAQFIRMHERSWNQNCEDKESVYVFGSSMTVQLRTLQTHQWEFLDACFLDKLSRISAMSLGLPGFPTYLGVIFLRGYLKSRVYLDEPRTFDELKTAIIKDITAILAEMLCWILKRDLSHAFKIMDITSTALFFTNKYQ